MENLDKLYRRLDGRIGRNETIALRRIATLLSITPHRHYDHDHTTIRDWTVQGDLDVRDDWLNEFPYWSRDTIRRTIHHLLDRGLLIVDNQGGPFHRVPEYTIDYATLVQMFPDTQETDWQVHIDNDKKEVITKIEKRIADDDSTYRPATEKEYQAGGLFLSNLMDLKIRGKSVLDYVPDIKVQSVRNALNYENRFIYHLINDGKAQNVPQSFDDHIKSMRELIHSNYVALGHPYRYQTWPESSSDDKERTAHIFKPVTYQQACNVARRVEKALGFTPGRIATPFLSPQSSTVPQMEQRFHDELENDEYDTAIETLLGWSDDYTDDGEFNERDYGRGQLLGEGYASVDKLSALVQLQISSINPAQLNQSYRQVLATLRDYKDQGHRYVFANFNYTQVRLISKEDCVHLYHVITQLQVI